jgi:hypothetical protein
VEGRAWVENVVHLGHILEGFIFPWLLPVAALLYVLSAII